MKFRREHPERREIAEYQQSISELIADPYIELENDDGSSQAPVKNNTTLTVLEQRHHDLTVRLSGTKTLMQILDVAHDLFTKPRALKISNIICLGLGSLSGAVGRCCCTPTTPEAEVEANTEAMAQLVFLEEWIKQLRTRFEIPDSKIYFQDPMFNSVDREFLTSLGYTVISSPASSSILNNETFLFAPLLEEIPLYMSLKTSFPGIYMGDSLTDNHSWSMVSNADFQRFVKTFVDGCKKSPQIDMSANSETEDHRKKLATMYYPLSDGDNEKAEQRKSMAARGLNILKRGWW